MAPASLATLTLLDIGKTLNTQRYKFCCHMLACVFAGAAAACVGHHCAQEPGHEHQQAGGHAGARLCCRDGVRGAVSVHQQGWAAGAWLIWWGRGCEGFRA